MEFGNCKSNDRLFYSDVKFTLPNDISLFFEKGQCLSATYLDMV